MNTEYIFAGMTNDEVRKARASHMSIARYAPSKEMSSRYAGYARLANKEIIRRAFSA